MMTSLADPYTSMIASTIKMAAWKFTLKHSQRVLAGVLLRYVDANMMAILNQIIPFVLVVSDVLVRRLCT